MKKIIALFLAVIMMFSMTSVSYAADTTVGTETSVNTIDNYMDYLEEKLEGENFFVQLIARLVIIGVMLGFIKVEDFEAWFDNTAPDTDTDAEVDNDKPTEDNNTNTDWEDGTEVTLHHAQALPYTEGDVTITDVKVTKEHYDGLDKYNSIVNCKYNFEIHGKCSEYIDGDFIDIDINLEKAHYILSIASIGENSKFFEISDDGTFVCKFTHYSAYDSSCFSFRKLACHDYDYGT